MPSIYLVNFYLVWIVVNNKISDKYMVLLLKYMLKCLKK